MFDIMDCGANLLETGPEIYTHDSRYVNNLTVPESHLQNSS